MVVKMLETMYILYIRLHHITNILCILPICQIATLLAKFLDPGHAAGWRRSLLVSRS